MPNPVLLAFQLVTVGLGTPTFALDADVCTPATAIVRGRGRALYVTVTGRASGSCRFGYETMDGTWECSVNGGFVVFTSEGAHPDRCRRHWVFDYHDFKPDLVWEGKMADGLREGPWVGWWYTGDGREIWESVSYRHGQRNGEFISYRDPVHGFYLNDHKFGYWIEREAEGEYVNDRMTGLWITPPGLPGIIWRAMVFKEGRFHGPDLIYEDGVLRTVGAYRDGLRTGVWKTFNRRGILISEQRYRLGQHHGLERAWDDDGVLVARGMDGKMVEVRPRRRGH